VGDRSAGQMNDKVMRNGWGPEIVSQLAHRYWFTSNSKSYV
jgi:hypothetical protein